MTRRERFHRTLERRDVDRPATWLGEPTPGAVPALCKHAGTGSIRELKERFQDDVFEVNVPYRAPGSDHIATSLNFAVGSETASYEERSLTTRGFFEGLSVPEDVASFDWPDPVRYIDPGACRELVNSQPDDVAVLALMWSAHFQDSCAAFGMETALVNMLSAPEIFEAVDSRIVDHYLRANEVFYEAVAHRLDAVLIGDDVGTQTGLLMSPDLVRKYVLPGARRLVEQAHSYGFKVIYHSCGSIYPVVADLLEIGVDAIHPIQALAADMSAEHLHAEFGGRASFCGGVDAQQLLVNGTPEEIAVRVTELRRLFPTGLVISPSHEAILPDIPPANVVAFLEAAHR
jgi:uroporphyrinogen decarboxylase